jgi:SAM-dependent methyltransferase
MSRRIDTWPSAKQNDAADRKRRTGEVIIELLHDVPQPRVLDIGGIEYEGLARQYGWQYVSVDLESPQTVGTGGYQHEASVKYDGKTLPFEPGSFDLVIVGFVLHHAAENTLGLLQQIKAISRRHVLVGEDVADQHYPPAWHERNFAHHPGGVFRADEEWCQLFAAYGMRLVRTIVVRRDDDFDERMYRVLYVLDASSS